MGDNITNDEGRIVLNNNAFCPGGLQAKIRIRFQSKEHAEAARLCLSVDEELQPNRIKKLLMSVENYLIA